MIRCRKCGETWRNIRLEYFTSQYVCLQVQNNMIWTSLASQTSRAFEYVTDSILPSAFFFEQPETAGTCSSLPWPRVTCPIWLSCASVSTAQLYGKLAHMRACESFMRACVRALQSWRRAVSRPPTATATTRRLSGLVFACLLLTRNLWWRLHHHQHGLWSPTAAAALCVWVDKEPAAASAARVAQLRWPNE